MKSLIFISCGQQTEEERSLGLQAKKVVDATPDFEAYFAQSVQSLDSLRDNIFEALSECSGAIIFIHNRGKALNLSGAEWGNRSSVWVNQEIAILAYRHYRETQNLPILAFKDERVKLEGAMTVFIVNPLPITEIKEMLEQIQTWLKENTFSSPCSQEKFSEKWAKIVESSRCVLSCLIDEGGIEVSEEVIRQCLIAKFKLSNNEASTAIRKARIDFQNTNLVRFERNEEALYEFSIHPTWNFYLRRAISTWHALEKKS
jgi:hypothetical protein